MAYCGDHLNDYGVVYLQGPGKFGNMDPDCDGIPGGPHDDGRCDASHTTQHRTSARSTVQALDVGIEDLSPWEHSYVVFGNVGEATGWKTFNPDEFGIEMTSVMAVVCGGKMFYGIWGDVNGGDSEKPSVGEASISLATACFGDVINASDGDGSSHNEEDVLYIAFTGKDAVPGRDGAAWDAGSFQTFHDSLIPLGEELIARIGGDGGFGNGGAGSEGGEGGDCTWEGHCKGASCSSADDCSDALTCYEGACAVRCTWMGHCKGSSCDVASDCSDDLTCSGGVCTER